MDHKVGFHLKNAGPMSGNAWKILARVPPKAVVLIAKEQILHTDVERILDLSGYCHVFLRYFFPPSDQDSVFNDYVATVKEDILDGKWDFIPFGQRHIQLFNEPNMPGGAHTQWEGFGPHEEGMMRLNRWFCMAYDEIKAADPTWKIGFPPLTPGNLDAYFNTDPERVHYYTHGPQVAFGDPFGPGPQPTEEQRLEAVESCICREALLRADEYLAHIYVINDAGNQMHEPWYGLRFARYAGFFPKPMDIWIVENDIGGPGEYTKDWFALLNQYPDVKGVGFWQIDGGIDSPDDRRVIAMREWTGGLAPVPDLPPDPDPEPDPSPILSRCLVGVCGRNDHAFQAADVDLLRRAKIEMVKTMSFTNLSSYAAARIVRPECRFIVRLYDGRIGHGYHTSPQEFVSVMVPVVESLRPYTDLFEVHNEPNHLTGLEGWGQEDHHARDFNDWFLDVVYLLDAACPWAKVGFPGLAIPHRDIEWLEICREAILAADWLGCHNYWQNPTADDANHLSNDWGLRFKRYHQNYPDKDIHITEFGNSNCQNPALPFDRPTIAQEYKEYYEELFKPEYAYVLSASSFIMSAPQPEWSDFCWRDEGGHFYPVVGMVGAMDRPEPEPEPGNGDFDLVREARETCWKELGIPFNPDATFPKYARKHGLGFPVTKEMKLSGGGKDYTLQGYGGAIVIAVTGEWDKVFHVNW